MNKKASFQKNILGYEHKADQPIELDRTLPEQLERIGRQLFDIDLCVLLMPEEEHWIRSLAQVTASEYNRWVQNIGKHNYLVIPDTRVCPFLHNHPLVIEDPCIRFLVYVMVSPDTIQQDELVTFSLFLADREPRAFTTERLQLLADFLHISHAAIRGQLIHRKVLALVEKNRQLENIATIDHLTSLWNRDTILNILDQELARCARQALPISIIVADLDHFKLVNDRYGHITGDVVLKEMGRRLKHAVRTYDAVGRFGGEEFLIVMSDCDELAAASVAERIQDTIRMHTVRTGDVELAITISQGLVTYRGTGDTNKDIGRIELFEQADKALYLAKAHGRDSIQRNTDIVL